VGMGLTPAATTRSFETTAIDRRGKDRTNIMSRNQIAWWFWAIGTVLVVLSWMNVVSYTIVGWVRFGTGWQRSQLGRAPAEKSVSDQSKSSLERSRLVASSSTRSQGLVFC
jgi:hypothetical protein